MRGKLGDKIRLQHIYDAITELETYIEGKVYSDFENNSMLRFACIKQMEIIGEASNHISDETKLKFQSIEWAQIVGMRNFFVHEYFGVDSNIVWEILNNDIPELKEKVKEIIHDLK